MNERRQTTYNRQRENVSPCIVTPDNPTSHLLGSKVVIQTADGEYEGVVKHVWGNLEKVSLSKVVALPSKKPYVGVHNFFNQDIIKITVVEPKLKAKTQTNVTNAVKLQPINLADLNVEETQDYVENEDEDDDNASACVPCPASSELEKYSAKGIIIWNDDDTKDTKSGPENMRVPLPSRYVILDQINEDFHTSVEDINSSSFVGVSMDCTKGRLGGISLLCVAAKSAVYLFDIMTLGIAPTFDNGLRRIFESTSVTKVVHDCRLLSDALFHLCNVKLTNVFDTQVGDVVLHLKQNQNKLPQYVSSLSQCLQKYLKLETEFLPKDELFQKNDSHWKMRPLPGLCQQNAIRTVIFLQELRQTIMEGILADLTLGVDIYMNAVRQASMEELALNLGSTHVLPPAMSCLTSHEMKFLHPSTFENTMESSDNLWRQPSLSRLENHRVQNYHHATLPNNSEQNNFKWIATKKNLDHQNAPQKLNNNVLANGVSNLRLAEEILHEKGNKPSMSEVLKNVKWASNYGSLPKNKCTPAGKLLNNTFRPG